MKEHMENLIKLLQERKTVERLIEAEDKFELFVNEKKELENELENLKKIFSQNNTRGCEELEILPSNVLEICMVCILANIDEIYLFSSCYDKIPEVLWKVEGIKKKTARLFSDFLEEDNFSGLETKYLLNKFF